MKVSAIPSNRRAAALRLRLIGLTMLALLCAGAAVQTVARAGATIPPRGALLPLSGHGACFAVGGGCDRLRGPRALLRIAISRDGRNVYLSGQTGGVAVLARDAGTGRLRQLSGRAGCLRADGLQGCATVPALVDPGSVTVTADGRSVYLTSTHGILNLVRDHYTGALRLPAGTQGCLDAVRTTCGHLRGLSAPTALLAAGNGTLYAAGTLPDGHGGTPGGLAVLRRDGTTGALVQLSGRAGCFNLGGLAGCTSVRCLHADTTLALSRDGNHLYVGSTDSLDFELTSPGAVSTFARAAGSSPLSFVGCAGRAAAVSDLIPGPQGNSVLVSTLFGNRGTGVASAGIDLYGPKASGELARRRQLACSSDSSCPIPFSPETSRLALTPHRDTVYLATFFGGVAALHAGAHGLTPLRGRWACVVARAHFSPPPRCARTGEEIGVDLAVSPDGRDLYVGTLGNGSSSFYAGGIEGFRIQR